MGAIAFASSFVLGRAASTWLYQATWTSGQNRRFPVWGAFAGFLLRPWPWLVHLPILALTLGLDWQDWPRMRVFVCGVAISFALGAIGRIGAADLNRLFLFDRFIVLGLTVGLWFTPACLYPLLLSGCALQYVVSGFPLNPDYSNLLGWEFLRSTLSLSLASLLFGLPEEAALAVALTGQAAGYVAQAVAKSALGPKWYSWITGNRLECLFVNAWLRGWGAARIPMKGMLRLAHFIARYRIPLCAVAWIVEFSWLGILANRWLALGIVAATGLFHLSVWLLTGLAGYHYLVSHVLATILIASDTHPTCYLGLGIGCLLLATCWTLIVRRQAYQSYLKSGGPGRWSRLLDPAEHLMAWWDGPYMRLYSYSVTVESGSRFRFPVTRFSPYDTFLTDIHTHLMILGRDWELDPDLAADRAQVRTGVWGLTVSVAERDKAHTLRTFLAPLSPPLPTGSPISQSCPPLQAFIRGHNELLTRPLYRFLFRWPHFPGEDQVPDWSPLSEPLPNYEGSAPITEIVIHRTKTFYTGESVVLLDDRILARIPIPNEAHV